MRLGRLVCHRAFPVCVQWFVGNCSGVVGRIGEPWTLYFIPVPSGEDAVLENEESIPLLEVGRRGEGSLEISVDEEGLLSVYTLEGSLLRSARCLPGTNRVTLPSRKGMMILRYVTASGRCKSLKVM